MSIFSAIKGIFKGKEFRALWKEREKIKGIVVEVASALADDGKMDADEAILVGRKAYDLAKALGWI